MPTGYTEGVVKGEIDTAEAFAKLCANAFGVNIDDNNAPRTPEKFYLVQSKEVKKDLAKFEKKSLKSLEKEMISFAKKDVQHYKSELARMLVVKGRIERLIEQVKKLKLSKAHANFKEFMLSQLKATIEWDCNTEYYEEKLKDAQSILESPFDVKKYRKDTIAYYKNRIKSHEADYKKELKRCAEANKWASDLIKVLNKSH